MQVLDLNQGMPDGKACKAKPIRHCGVAKTGERIALTNRISTARNGEVAMNSHIVSARYEFMKGTKA